MFKRKRTRNLAVLVAVFALTAGVSLAQVQSAKASSYTQAQTVYRPSTSPYPTEAVYRQSSLGTTWCITADGSSPGDTVVLGKCAGAATQELFPEPDGNYYELVFESDGLCITYPNAQGHADGVKAEQGRCTYDVSQLFLPVTATTDWAWVLNEKDNNGKLIAINDAGGVLKAYNPINSSYTNFTTNSSGNLVDTVASEDFGGPY